MPVLMVMAITVRGITGTLLITTIVSATGHTITTTVIPTPITITDTNLIDITAIGPRVPVGREVPGEDATGAARIFQTGAEGLEVGGQAVLRQEASRQEVAGKWAVADGQAWAAVGDGAEIGRNSLLWH